MKTHIKNLLPLLLLLGLPGLVEAQDAYSTNADGSIYTYSTNADGSANIVAYAGPPWVVTIPTNINGLTVTTIGVDAFSGSSLTNATIGNSVTSIGEDAFSNCHSLTSVTIPSSVTSIGDDAFAECSSLTSVTIPNSITSIGDDTFGECSSLTSVTIPNSVTSIGGDAFFYCSRLTSVTIGNSVTSIGDEAFFDDYSLTNIIIPDSVTSIANYAFSYCRLTSVTIPNSVTSIGEYAFAYCSSLHQAYFQGNAPDVDGVAGSADNSVFHSESGTAYYLPGAIGWSSTFGGWPTALWYQPTPLILGGGSGLGVQSNQFGFTISWATNVSVVVEAATNLANPVWIPVSTNTLTGGTSSFSDPQWTNYPGRYYRLRSP